MLCLLWCQNITLQSIIWWPVFASQISELRKRICRVEPTPLQVSSYTHLLYKVQDPISACRQSQGLNKVFNILFSFDVGPVFASQISELRKRICRVEPTPLQVSSYTHLLYKVQDPISACRQSQGLNKVFKILFSFDVGPVFASQISELRKRICRVEPTPLQVSSYTHLLYKVQDPISACRQSQGLNKVFNILFSFDVGPVFASQINKLRKRIGWVEPTPYQVSSYTHLLYKVQNPFNTCRQSQGLNNFSLTQFGWRTSLCFTDQ